MAVTNVFTAHRMYKTAHQQSTMLARGTLTVVGANASDVDFPLLTNGQFDGMELLSGRLWAEYAGTFTASVTCVVKFKMAGFPTALESPILSVAALSAATVVGGHAPDTFHTATPVTGLPFINATVTTLGDASGTEAHVMGSPLDADNARITLSTQSGAVTSVTVDYMIHLNLRDLGGSRPL